MVSSLAAAISDVGLDAADHHLDCEHYPHIRPMALARTWPSVGVASWLGNAAGIRMRGNRRCDNCIPPAHAAGGTSILKRTSPVKPIGPTRNSCIRKSRGLIQHSIRSIHRGGTFMTNLSRLDVIRRLAFSMLLILPATLGAQQRARQREKRRRSGIHQR